MPDSLNSLSEKAGMPPGSLIHVGEVPETETTISLISYNKEDIGERTVLSADDIPEFRKKRAVTWVHIEGLRNVELMASVGEMFDVHPLVVEDILNTHQRSKFEEYDDHLYIVLKGVSLGKGVFSVDYEQISILVFKNMVFTFREKADEMFHPVRQRIRNNKGRLRSLGADYLAYAILDMIVDQNFVLLDSLDEIIESAEEELLTDITPETLTTIQQIKREVIDLRRVVSPLRELLAAILRSNTALISEKTRIYFRDVYDHVLHITEAADSYREMLSGLIDIYLSGVSNKMNEVMKFLTVFASIFIPLTFIAGIYGMNFEHMPELRWRWAYPLLWAVFLVIPVVLLLYFRKKKWL